jgi:hypothetical protein
MMVIVEEPRVQPLFAQSSLDDVKLHEEFLS